jgi:tryptophan synthase alpha chain
MNEERIAGIFDFTQLTGAKLLNVYCTAGYPQLNSTMEIMQLLQEGGAGMIELGMPYSDPLADGPVIQQSSMQALANGMTIEVLFQQLEDLREKIILPVILMGYLNPVLQYGFERFCCDAAEVGIDGLILPDMPIYEFENEYGPVVKKYGLDFIFLVTPETSEDRIRKLDALSSGFLYAVSSSSTTGGTSNMEQVEAYLKRLAAMKLKNPVMAGFGIHDKKSFNAVCEHAAGGIIGTAFIKALQRDSNVRMATMEFLAKILAETPGGNSPSGNRPRGLLEHLRKVSRMRR